MLAMIKSVADATAPGYVARNTNELGPVWQGVGAATQNMRGLRNRPDRHRRPSPCNRRRYQVGGGADSHWRNRARHDAVAARLHDRAQLQR